MNLLRLWNSLFDVKGNTVLPMKQIITVKILKNFNSSLI